MEECNICFNDLNLEDAWKCKKCKQICHHTCIRNWYKNRKVCPFCIQDISSTNIKYTEVNTDEYKLCIEPEQETPRFNIIEYLCVFCAISIFCSVVFD